MGDAQAGEFLQVDADGRVLVHKIGQQLRQILRDGGGIAQQAHLAFKALGVLGHVVMHPLDLLQQQPGMLRQGLPGGCRADTPAAALQTLNPKRGLHGTNARTTAAMTFELWKILSKPRSSCLRTL